MEAFFCAVSGKKLPGKHGQQDLSACPRAPSKTSKRLRPLHFPSWHDIRSPHDGEAARAWESRCGSEIGRRTVWEGCPRRAWSKKGRTTDGECASRRTIATGGVGAATRRARQQHRERQHRWLQGRRIAVRGVSELG